MGVPKAMGRLFGSGGISRPKYAARRRLMTGVPAGPIVRFQKPHPVLPKIIMSIPDFHDARLISFAWSANEVRAGFRSIDDAVSNVQIIGVSQLRVNDLREGNVVDEVVVFGAGDLANREQVVRDWLEYLVCGSELLPDNPAYVMLDEAIRKLIAAIASGEVSLFSISSSYGCTMACVFKELRLAQG